ncbi:MAG TPA: YlxR family protein [Syntrophomonadaceae bacterium]|mgnify:CR=1 FL=1|nr:YlxR family protein [Syntrophomonadaceae bacterium]HQA06902.1 YlxR family protein [Syntrophomonadaceae bacterium]HQE22714.1 YlxR family protein [Syntrophomonadaceae bacterium]
MNRPRKIPQRMCVGCREMRNKRELIRIVRTPQETVEMDTTGKKAGRGAYICPNTVCFSEAIKGKRLQKALNKEIPDDVLERIKMQIDDMMQH